MRVAHKVGLFIAVIVLLLLALLLPRTGHADQSAVFGDIIVRYSAISTDQLFADIARRYGIERSTHNGLVNIAVEQKSGAGEPALIAASVSGSVADLTGHGKPIRFHETRDEGAIDYLGEFPIDASGTYVFTIYVTPGRSPSAPQAMDGREGPPGATDGREGPPPGRAQPYTVKFNRDYVLD
jgi:hypothetical protein